MVRGQGRAQESREKKERIRMGKGFWMFSIAGLPLAVWLVGLLAVSIFSWVALHTIVPIVLLLGLVAGGLFLVHSGVKSKQSVKGIPIGLAYIGIGLVMLGFAVFSYRPTAGYTLSVMQSVAPTNTSASGGLFDGTEILGFVDTSSIPVPEWIIGVLAISTLVALWGAFKMKGRR